MRQFILVVLLFCMPAHAYFQMDLFRRRESEGESSQWTVFDWLAQKNKMALADQWLALNRSTNLFDIHLSGGSQSYKLKTDNGTVKGSHNQYSESYNLDMYISIFGLHGEYVKSNEDREAYGGSLGLRLLGTSSRSTYFTANYGWRKLQDLGNQEVWENQYAEGQLQLYLIKYFGLNGRYRYYFPATSSQGSRLEGYRVTAGAFIDVLIFRLFGDYFQEPMTVSKDGVTTKEDRQGYEAGVKLYF